jgi:phage shock protein PspC (stress-responsive transcriptional regulator)
MTLSDDIAKLVELRANGGLTEDEFTRAKARLLGDARSGDADLAAPAARVVLRRSRGDRWLGGVCGGVARATGVEAWVWRLLFAALFICAGAGLLVYLLLWIFVPSE